MATIVNQQGFIDEESDNGSAPVLSLNAGGAKINPQGYLYAEKEVNGTTGIMPVVSVAGGLPTALIPTLQQVTDAGTISTNRVRFAGYGLTSYGTNAGKDILSPLIIDGNNAVWAGMTPISYSSGNPNADGTTGCGVGFDRSIRAEGADVGVYSFRLTNSINGLAYNTKLSDTAGNWSGWRHLWHDQNLPYETGSWTPSIQGLSTAGVAAYTIRNGGYVRIGKQVTVMLSLDGTFTTAPTGQVAITGLPFVVITNSSGVAAIRIGGGYMINEAYLYTSNNSSMAVLGKTAGINNPLSVAVFGTDHSTTNFQIRATLTYLIA